MLNFAGAMGLHDGFLMKSPYSGVKRMTVLGVTLPHQVTDCPATGGSWTGVHYLHGLAGVDSFG